MNKSPSCTYASTADACPIVGNSCDDCPWDRDENARRRALPLTKDEATGLLRKIVGRRGGDAAAPETDA